MSSSFSSSTPGKPWQPPAPGDLAPELPQYEILGLLGRGGMGAVFHARQKSLKREVAIKLLPPTIEDADMSYGERFKAEAQVMARLNHPGIIAVYDAGETPGGLLYFVMEYVQGTDVHQMIASSGKLPPQHAHAITAHVCDALAYAHANGLIHRDIKPANIMVDTQGRVKVADFGLAKMANDDHGFTKSNMAVGTPDFVAPEALITGMPVDGRADLYAVGVMLYQMLTGQIPRGAWHPVSVVVPGTDRRFDDIIVKAMQYDREARHGSASELRQHLDTLLMPAVPAPDLQRYSSAGMAKSSPVAAQQEPPQHRAPAQPAKKPLPVESGAKNSKTGLWIGLGAAAALGIGAVVMFSGGKTAKQSSPPAPSSGTSAETAPQTAQSIVRTTTSPPKPSTLAPSPPPPVSKFTMVPSAQFPSGKWVKADFRSNNYGFQTPMAADANGAVSLKGAFQIPGLKSSNIAVRGTVTVSGRDEFFVWMRASNGVSSTSGKNKTLRDQIRIKRNSVLMMHETSEEMKSVGSLPEPEIWPLTFCFAAIEDKLYGATGSSPFVTAPARSKSDFGVLNISSAGEATLHSLEVLNLDGIPAAEALKILGVDEKGKDLRSPMVANTPTATPPVSETKSPVTNPGALPPGQWVKLFTKLEDLPADLRHPDSGVKFEDGWIDLAASAKWLRFPSVLTGNYAVKARFRRKSSAQNQIVVRRQITGGAGMYMLRYFQGVMSCLSRDAGKNQETKLFDMPVKDGVSDGGEYILEFGVVGGKLIGRYDTQVVGFAQDALCPEGVAHIQGSEPIRDVEVINLDGIPEAEALKILGVDEKGNDLQTLAAQQKAASMGLPLSTVAPAAPANAAAPLSEIAKQLDTLETQFQGAAEREAGAAFVQSVATLNQGYLRALAGSLKTVQAGGNLDQALVIQEETKRITANQPVPAEDEANAPDELKKLRTTYRTAHAKLLAERTQKLAPLYDRYDATLATLQTDLTKSGKLEDATQVKAKREEIAQRKGGVEVAGGGAGTTPSIPPTQAVVVGKRPKVKSDPRSVATRILQLGGVVTVQSQGRRIEINVETELPNKDFGLIAVKTIGPDINSKAEDFNDEDFHALCGLRGIESIEIAVPSVSASAYSELEHLADSAQTVFLIGSPCNDEICAALGKRGVGGSFMLSSASLTPTGISLLKTIRSTIKLNFNSSTGVVSAENARAMATLKNLSAIMCSAASIFSDEALAEFKTSKVQFFRLNSGPLRAPGVLAKSFPETITGLNIMYTGITDDNLPELAQFQLTQLDTEGHKITDRGCEHIALIKTLTDLRLVNSAITDAGLVHLAKLTKLTNLKLTGSAVTDAGVTKLKKALPKCVITR